jgi:hypothetical protein
MAYANDVNLLGDNIDTINEKTETLIYASKGVGLEVSIEKIKSIFVSPQPNFGQNREEKIADRSFEKVAQYRYLGIKVINQSLIQEEIKRRLNCGNACYHSVQNLSSSRLLSRT